MKNREIGNLFLLKVKTSSYVNLRESKIGIGSNCMSYRILSSEERARQDHAAGVTGPSSYLACGDEERGWL